MDTCTKFFIISMLMGSFLQAQPLTMYTPPGALSMHSPALNASITLELVFPIDTGQTATTVQYPLVVLFDSYNTHTFEHNLRNIDILTYHGQMPPCVVVGVPFDAENRYYLTSMTRRPTDSLAGIERLERFLFDELLPRLRSDHRVGGPVVLLGHSRSAFLTSYLMTRRHADFEAAGSFSGFFEQGFQPADLQAFLNDYSTTPTLFAYYLSAGAQTREEEIYLAHMRALRDTLQARAPAPPFKWRYLEHPFAGHMANFNLSVPMVLTDFFGPFNGILEGFLFDKLNRLTPESILDALRADFEQLSAHYGHTLSPNPTHFISLANDLLNKEAYPSALALLVYGKTLYPGSYDLDYYTALALDGDGRKEDARELVRTALERLRADAGLSGDEKAVWEADFSELIRE